MPNNNSATQKKDATLNDILAVLEKNQNTLDEISTWIKISGIEKVRDVLTTALDTPEKKTVYHLSDGSTVQEIESKCSLSDSQISRYQKRWYNLGLMKKERARGRGDRHVKVFDLEDFGIEIPKVVSKVSSQKTQEVPPQTTEADNQNQTAAQIEGKIKNE